MVLGFPCQSWIFVATLHRHGGDVFETPNGSSLALITIFDVDSRMVYLFRTHLMFYQQLQSLRREMRVVAINRWIVTFGPEFYLIYEIKSQSPFLTHLN
ncbi:hypothetical protein GCK72_020734 [Caenorhabditis remanei]|uniref:Uncharacterized protein n=1 Tax=Caenorhabditis remanei TaxID=31234 RepID=A0A6A5GHD3_CAERE|nr:hypothetical protein GCK72_020734 [Caenorhabditis remanei]KAF1754174.1 hypothetical protein GCK72_020734 [Caenorhabditis remanei]